MKTVQVRVVAVLVAMTAALTLSACGGGTPATPVTSATSPPVTSAPPTQTPTPAPTPTSTAVLPTDCATLATEPTRQQTVGDMTLQGDGEGFVRPAPAGATLALGCDWIVGDTTGVLLLISTAEPGAVTTAVGALAPEGYTCQASDDFGAEFCDLPGTGTDTEELIVARDDVWIYMSTSNRNGREFLSEIVQGIFG